MRDLTKMYQHDQCHECLDYFDNNELHLYENDNGINWYCDECLNTVLHENEGFN